MSNLWSKSSYIAALPYVVGQYITEYDMSKANISVLLYKGVIDKKLYDELYNSDKFYREKYIGMMQRNNPKISEIKSEGIAEFRKKFIEANELTDDRILSIKSDAIFVLGEKCNYTKFDDIVNFRVANKYNAFMKIGNLELYYGIDSFTENENFDVKGIKDEKLEWHRDGMATFICDVFYRLLTRGSQDALKYSQEFLSCLLRRTLPASFYRDFNAESMYSFISMNSRFTLPNIADNMIQYVDISTNVNFTRGILGILSDIYLSEQNRSRK